MMDWFPTFKDFTAILDEKAQDMKVSGGLHSSDAMDKARIMWAQERGGKLKSGYDSPLRALIADLLAPKFDTSSSVGRYFDQSITYPITKKIMGQKEAGNPRGSGKTRA